MNAKAIFAGVAAVAAIAGGAWYYKTQIADKPADKKDEVKADENK